jgi:hypothetical protein
MLESPLPAEPHQLNVETGLRIQQQGGILADNDSTGASALNAQTLTHLMRDLATAPYRIERATTVPFDKKRHENDAEHSFSLGVMALCVAPLVDRELDLTRISTYALVHDLAEIYAGDTPVYSDPATRAAKPKRERIARAKLHEKFGSHFPWLLNYLDDYVDMRDEESKFVYALDKVLPHVSVIIADHHPARPSWRAYKASEKIAREKISTQYPKLSQVFEELCQMYGKLPHLFSTPPGRDDGNPLSTAYS